MSSKAKDKAKPKSDQPFCSGCKNAITGKFITAMNKNWCIEHFVCKKCKGEMGTRKYFEKNGYPYCKECFQNLFSPKCAQCSQPILDGKCIEALDKTWHPDHFCCAHCGQKFGREGFLEHDGKPYCRTDYFDVFAPKCTGCQKPILESCVNALNSKWHPECFFCVKCRKPVSGKTFYAREGRPACSKCVTGNEED